MWSLIVGNGFTIDASKYVRLPYDSSYPWDWNLKNPYNGLEPILEVFPNLKKHLNSIEDYKNKTIIEVLENIVKESEYKEFYAQGESASENDYVHLESCHFLRIAYAWYSQRFKKDKLKSWIWTKWLKENGEDIKTIMSYNYDTLLENVLDVANLGIVHASTRQNFIFENGFFNPSEPVVYIREKVTYKKNIHIAKPHGSSNFTGWVRLENSIEGVRQNIYPMKSILVRDSTEIKVLEKKLLEPTYTADLVLPGEWSCWNRTNHTQMEWVEHQKRIFVEDSNESTKLLIIGFSFGNPDQGEFKEVMDRVKSFDEIYLVDPYPSKELVKYLDNKFHCKIFTINPTEEESNILDIKI